MRPQHADHPGRASLWIGFGGVDEAQLMRQSMHHSPLLLEVQLSNWGGLEVEVGVEFGPLPRVPNSSMF